MLRKLELTCLFVNGFCLAEKKNRGRIFAGRISVRNGQGMKKFSDLFPSQLYFLSFLRVFNSHIFSLLCTFPLIAILDREFYLVVRPTEIADIFTFRHFQKKNCVASRYTLNCLQISGNKTCRGHDAAAEKTDKFSFSRKRFRTVYFLRRFRKDVTLSV